MANGSAWNTWYDYRTVWSRSPSVLALAVLAVVVLVVSVIGTVLGTLLAIFFIPGLALLYFHHLVVQKRLDS